MSKTFLELAQMAARESGTISGTLPTSVEGQTGRLLKFVEWTKTAWLEIQNRRASWQWMRAEFSGPLTSPTARYTAASFSIDDRFAEWITEYNTLTIYLTATGVSDEGPLDWIPWQLYRSTYERGTQTADRPVAVTVSPTNQLCFGPKPDAAYTVRGEYRKSPQILESNNDEPELPGRFHDIIAWYALLLMAEHDEANLPIAMAMRRYRQLKADLERDQLPRVTIGSEPIA